MELPTLPILHDPQHCDSLAYDCPAQDIPQRLSQGTAQTGETEGVTTRAAAMRPCVGARDRRLRSLGTFAEPAPELEAKEPAPAEPRAVSPKIFDYYYLVWFNTLQLSPSLKLSPSLACR